MHPKKKRTVLVLDDDEINLMILIKGVESAGFIPRPFTNAESAWQHMLAHPHTLDLALLDKMMPGVDGMELLRRMKAHPELKQIPAIIQTGDVGVDQMREGLEAGAYYYLTKPFHPEILIAILHAAANECAMREEMAGQLESNISAFRQLAEGIFLFSTHAEARHICATIGQLTPKPEKTAAGLMELMANAIEHGMLGIGHAHKRAWLLGGAWEDRLAAHAAKPEYVGRAIQLHIRRVENTLQLVIRDWGEGFNWREFLSSEESLLKLNEPNGRGIARAIDSLDRVEYKDSGNEVYCTIILGQASAHPAEAA